MVNIVGLSDGDPEGDVEGRDDGVSLGWLEGTSVGDEDGNWDNDGDDEGTWDFEGDTEATGEDVGESVSSSPSGPVGRYWRWIEGDCDGAVVV